MLHSQHGQPGLNELVPELAIHSIANTFAGMTRSAVTAGGVYNELQHTGLSGIGNLAHRVVWDWKFGTQGCLGLKFIANTFAGMTRSAWGGGGCTINFSTQGCLE